jgi:hypothetical protein
MTPEQYRTLMEALQTVPESHRARSKRYRWTLVEPVNLHELLVAEKLPIIAIEAVLDDFKLRAYDAPRLADRYWYLTTSRGMRYPNMESLMETVRVGL